MVRATKAEKRAVLQQARRLLPGWTWTHYGFGLAGSRENVVRTMVVTFNDETGMWTVEMSRMGGARYRDPDLRKAAQQALRHTVMRVRTELETITAALQEVTDEP